MRTAAAIPVPHGIPSSAWVDRVNQRAGRAIVQVTTAKDKAVYATTASTPTILKAGQFVLVIDAIGSTAPALYQIVDTMELLG